MSFGQKVLQKYGWNEGEGLGKNGDGIKEAIRPKRKNNVLGLGYKLGDEFKDNWWENVYDNAASNITVHTDKEGESCSVTKAVNMDVEVPLMGRLKAKKKSFIKESEILPEDPCERKNLLTDDEIFKKCGGRTAHKGARHGLSLSGKLSRIEKQEQRELKKRLLNDSSLEKRKKQKS